MSIKKKFATAVATASLLAGLFGSAFVPSAMGAVILPSTPVVAKYTTTTEGSLVQQAGTAKVFGFQTNDSEDSAVNADTYIDVALFTAGASGAGTTKLDLTDANNADAVLKASSSNGAVNVGWAYDNDTTDTLPADSDGVGDDTAGDGSPDAVACNGDITVGTTSSVKNVTGSNNAGALADVDVVGYPTAHNGIFRLCLAAETVATAATSTVTITWDGATVATFTVTAVGPIASLTASITDDFKYVAEDNEVVDDWFTIIAKDAAGVVINGLSTSVSNEDLTIFDWEDNPENVQEDQVMPLDGFDSGNDSTAPGGAFDYSVYNLDSDTCVSESGAGEDDGDAGASYSVKFADAATDADVVSNAITITCTGGIDGARVTKVTPETKAGAMVYEGPTALDNDTIDIVATLVDADGAPLGDGTETYIDDEDEDDGGYDMLIDFEGADDLNWSPAGPEGNVVVRGEVVVGTLAPEINPGKHTYKISFDNSDLAVYNDSGDEVAKVFTDSYTAAFVGYDGDISKSRNAAKTTATVVADFGDAGQYGKIKFTIQTANGAQRTVTLNAGSDGAATLVFSRRNQRVNVYAELKLYGGLIYVGETETIPVRFR
jgi:hypothetical protein